MLCIVQGYDNLWMKKKIEIQMDMIYEAALRDHEFLLPAQWWSCVTPKREI